MRTHHILLLGASIFIAGCDQPGAASTQDKQRYQQQAETYEQGMKRADANLAHMENQTKKADEQMTRYDKILDKWEEQAKRMDAILDKMEKGQGIKN